MITPDQLLKATDSISKVGSDPEFLLTDKHGIDANLIFSVARSYYESQKKATLTDNEEVKIEASFMLGFMLAIEVLLGEKDA